MWYLYTLLGISITYPMFKAMVRALTGKEFYYMIIILVAFTIVLRCIEGMLGISMPIIIPMNSVYITYMMLGYSVDQQIKLTHFHKKL